VAQPRLGFDWVLNEDSSSSCAVGMWGFALSKKDEILALGCGNFPLSSFPQPPGGGQARTPSRNRRNLLQVDSRDRCCSSESL
jgi:hypothetical protein